MRLSPPTQVSWIIAVILGILGILVHSNTIRLGLGFEAFWLVVMGWALLAIASLVKRL
ncbi:MAG TPA: hypothetical protein VI669_07730 [Vicinamibacteria bacterium]